MEPVAAVRSSTVDGRDAGDRAALVAMVLGARRRDPASVDALVRRLVADLGPVCGGIALDDGDDALQETLLLVLRSLDQLREPAAIGGWARRIAVRESVRVARRRARIAPVGRDEHEVEVADVARARDELAAGADQRVDVAAVLGRLEPGQRAVLVLRHLHGLEEQEVAEMLEVPVGTVKSRASRARGAFARRWRP